MALKKIDPSKVFKTCSILDEAIDKKATGEANMKKFEESYEMKFLKFKEGEFPTIFHVMNLLSSEQAKIKQDHVKVEFPNLNEDIIKSTKIADMKPTIRQVNSQEMMIKYFKGAVKKYEEDGKEYDCNSDVFPFSVIQEIGSIVMMRSELGEDLKNVLGS